MSPKDGREFLLDAMSDDDGPYFDVLTPFREFLGTVRLLPGGKAQCKMSVPMADKYFAEIVTALQNDEV